MASDPGAGRQAATGVDSPPPPGRGLRVNFGEITALVGDPGGVERLVRSVLTATTRCAAGHPHGSVQYISEPLDVVDGLTLGDNLTMRADSPSAGCGTVPWEQLERRVRATWPTVDAAWDVPAGELSAMVRHEATLALAGLSGCAALVVDRLGHDLPSRDRVAVLSTLQFVATWPAVVLLRTDSTEEAESIADRVLVVDDSGACSPIGRTASR